MNRRVNIAELADGIAKRATIPVSYAEKFAQSFFGVIGEALVREKLVKVKGLGTFKLVDVEARESVDVNTGERILLSAHSKVSFTPDAGLRDAINRPFADFETVLLNDGTPTELMEKETAAEVETTSAEAEASPAEATAAAVAAVAAQQLASPAEVEASTVETEPEPVVAEKEEVEAKPEEAEATPAEATPAEDMPAEEEPTESAPAEDVPAETEVEVAPVEQEPVEAEPKTIDASEPMEAEPAEVVEPTTEAVADEAAAEVEAPNDQTPETLAEINNNESENEIETSKTNSMNNIIKNILAALVCMFIGYAICYYFRPFELPTLSPATQTEKSEVTTDDEQAKDAAVTEQTEATAEPQAAAPAPQVKNDYPQIEGGEYVIVGVLANDTMKAGKMLTKMAIQYYGDKDLYTYICKMNNIENPDIVPLNMPLVIPKLEKK